MVKILWFFALFEVISGAECLVAQALSDERALELELREKLRQHVIQVTSRPDHSIRVHLALQPNGKASFESRVSGRGYQAGLQVDLENLVRQQLQKRGYQVGLADGGVRVDLVDLESASTTTRDLALVLLCFFCLVLLKYMRRSVSSDKQISAQNLVSAVGPVKPASSVLADPTPPSPHLMDIQQGPAFHPGEGSWYLHALHDCRPAELKSAFKEIPFDKALVILNAVDQTERKIVTSKLGLRPVFKSLL